MTIGGTLGVTGLATMSTLVMTGLLTASTGVILGTSPSTLANYNVADIALTAWTGGITGTQAVSATRIGRMVYLKGLVGVSGAGSAAIATWGGTLATAFRPSVARTVIASGSQAGAYIPLVLTISTGGIITAGVGPSGIAFTATTNGIAAFGVEYQV
jgi:hypothetical protein